MPKLSVNTDELNHIADDIEAAKRESARIAELIADVEKQLNTIGDSRSFRTVGTFLHTNRSQVTMLNGRMQGFGKALRDAGRLYRATEKDICGMAGSGSGRKGSKGSGKGKDAECQKTMEWLHTICGDDETFRRAVYEISIGNFALSFLGEEYRKELNKVFGSKSFASYFAKYASENGEAYLGKKEYKVSDEMKSAPLTGLTKDQEKGAEEWLKEKGKRRDLKDETFYQDKDGNLYNSEGKQIDKDGNLVENGKTINPKDHDPLKREATLLEASREASVSKSIFEGKYKYGEGNEISAKVGNAEAHASLAAGLYVLDGNGNKIFSPGVDAEVGTSVTALEVDWKQQWVGDKNLGLNTDAKVTVGKAEAQASATGQIFGKDGKLNVQAGVKGSAEAIAAKAEGKVGLNVAGGEVSAKGGVQVGIGAHADVGYRNGVIKCDVGAAIGVGVSLDVEVDVGGMVNTVVGKARSIFHF